MDELPPIKHPPFCVPQNECDRILGEYMRAWSQVEFAVAETVQRLMRTDHLRASLFPIVFQMSALRSLMEAEGSHVLKPKDFKPFVKLLEELKALTGTRNKFVHGNWKVKIQMQGAVAVTAELLRYSPPTDSEDVRIMQNRKHQKSNHLWDKHHYTPERIIEETERLRPYAAKLRSFMDAVSVSRLETQLPQASHSRDNGIQ